MKKLYLLLLFASVLISAQKAELFNTTWKVTKITGETFPEMVPPVVPFNHGTWFTENPSNLVVSFFNSVSADISFIDDSKFTVNSSGCTMMVYMNDNGEVNQFFYKLCNFFNSGTFIYSIQNNGSEKTLIISNASFEQITFTEQKLAVDDADINKISVYPNPATEFIIVENLKTGSVLELSDASGKQLKNIVVKSNKEEIDIRNLKIGIYYLSSDGKMIQKIIKK